MAKNSTTFRASKLSESELEDARRLRQRFDAHKAAGGTQKGFASEFEMPGGASSITQHLRELRPISIEQAKAYMRGFNCSLEEISQSLAGKVQFSSPSAALDLEAKGDQFMATLASIPEADRDLAYKVTMQALLAFHPDALRAPKTGPNPPALPKKPPE